MIVLSRHPRQSIRIGDDIRVTVRAIASDHVVLAVEYCDAGQTVRRSCSLELDDRVEIPPNTKVGVVDISGDKVRLGVEVPQGTAVHRTEMEEASAIPDAVPEGAVKPMKNQNKRSATAMPKLQLEVDASIAIGDGLKLTLTDTDCNGIRLMVDGELVGGPDDGLRVREARELKVGSSFQLGTQVTVTLAAATEQSASLTFVCPAHLPVRKA